MECKQDFKIWRNIEAFEKEKKKKKTVIRLKNETWNVKNIKKIMELTNIKKKKKK